MKTIQNNRSTFVNDVLSKMKSIEIHSIVDRQAGESWPDYYSASRYGVNAALVNRAFAITGENSRDVGLRLMLIDSLYSTDKLEKDIDLRKIAIAIHSLGSDMGASQRLNAYLKYVSDKTWNLDGELVKRMFESLVELYGTSEAEEAVSLIAWYAQYLSGCDFPIYDSRVKQILPMVMKKLSLDCTEHADIPKSLDVYIDQIVILKKFLWSQQTEISFETSAYHVISLYLLTMAAFDSGNLTLLLNDDDYNVFVGNCHISDQSNFFEQVNKELRGSRTDLFSGCTEEKEHFLSGLREHYLELVR